MQELHHIQLYLLSHQRPSTRRQECDDRSLDPGSVTLVVDSKPDDRQPEGREREREEERVLEDGVGEMTQIAENTEGAEDDEDAAVQQYRDQNQTDVDQSVEEPADFALALHQREPAPEGERAEEVPPERIVVPRAAIDKKRNDEKRKAEPERDPQTLIPREV